MRTLFSLLWSLSICMIIHAQQQRWESGIFLGGANYQGDLVQEWIPELRETGPAAGAFGRFQAGPAWGIRAGLWYGRYTGSDQNFESDFIRRERGLNFETEVAEVSLQLEWEPFGHRRYPAPRTFKPIFSPYFFVGAGYAMWESRVDFTRTSRDYFQEDIEQDKQAVFPLQRFSLPVGLGLKIDLSRKVVLGLELGSRTAFSDLLDGISHTGNPDRNDWYTFAGLSFGRRFGPKDADRDGFPDKEDACPRVAGVETANGCPDADGDGVEDLEDLCPEDWGLPRLSGCPDMDGDEVIDLMDACPRVAGSVETDGCPDTDGDGITDTEDDCPEAAGFPEWGGCPDTDFDGLLDREDECPEEPGLEEDCGCLLVDTDGDGLIDEIDRCPFEAGEEVFFGCPDSDGDGVPDAEDKCPSTPGEISEDGCPPVAAADMAVLIEARGEVQFNTGSAVLKPESHQILDQIVEVMRRYPDYSLRIGGHTDSVGKADANQTLSEKRAQACYQYLIDHGIAAERLEFEGFGETRPVGDNQTVRGRKANRRVEFELFVD